MNWRHPTTELGQLFSHCMVIKVWWEKSKGGEKVEMCKFARYPSPPNPTQPGQLGQQQLCFSEKDHSLSIPDISSVSSYCQTLSLLKRENDSTFNNHPSYSFISSPQNSLFIILNQLYNTVFQAALKEKCRI